MANDDYRPAPLPPLKDVLAAVRGNQEQGEPAKEESHEKYYAELKKLVEQLQRKLEEQESELETRGMEPTTLPRTIGQGTTHRCPIGKIEIKVFPAKEGYSENRVICEHFHDFNHCWINHRCCEYKFI